METVNPLTKAVIVIVVMVYFVEFSSELDYSKIQVPTYLLLKLSMRTNLIEIKLEKKTPFSLE